MILGYYLNNRLVKKIIFTLAILQISSINNSFFSKKNLYEQFDKIFFSMNQEKKCFYQRAESINVSFLKKLLLFKYHRFSHWINKNT